MHRESRTDRWLRTGFILFLIVLVLLIVFNSTAKTSDVSNWIIAFANIAMAAAAIGAWRAARKFLSEFFAQEGYRLAIALINENVIHLGDENTVKTDAEAAIKSCEELAGKALSESELTYLEFDLDILREQCKYHKEWLNNIHSLSFRMETYGIYPAIGKQAALNEMTAALTRMSAQLDTLSLYLMSNVEAYKRLLGTRYSSSTRFSVKYSTKMGATLTEIDHARAEMVNQRRILLANGKHARTLFVVRDS